MSDSKPSTQNRNERKERLIASNKKALHEYFVLQKVEAGIALSGTEVKSLRAGKVNLVDAYVDFPLKDSNEMFLLHLNISPYEFGNRENHVPARARKLLVHEREAIRMREAIQEKGLTIVPLRIYFSGPYVKVELAIVKGKKHYDKRNDLKERDMDRAMRRGED